MAKIVFTANIQRHVASPEAEAAGRTVREVLEKPSSRRTRRRGAMCSTTRRRCASTWRSSSMGRSSAIARNSLTP